MLPFRNAGPAADDYVADGLTEDLIDLLSMSRGLRVRSRGVVMRHKGSEHDPRDLGRELGVQVVVEGTVRRAPGSFRINARLISVSDGFQLWAKRFDGLEAEMLAMNDQVARAVAAALTVELEGEARGAAPDPAAVDLYLQARAAYLSYFGRSRDDAARLFVDALVRSPDDPRIIAGYVMVQAQRVGDRPGAGALREQAEHALRLAPSLPDAHVALAAVLFQLNDAAGAVGPLRRAIELAPNHAEAHDMLGRLLLEADLAAGVRHVEAAMALEPNMGLPRASLARHFLLRGEADRAEAILDGITPRKNLAGVRTRFILWHGEKERAAELLAELQLESAVDVKVRHILDLAANGTRFPEISLSSDGRASPRSVAFLAQMETEVACFQGETDRAMRSLTRADADELYDLAWIDRCPVLGPIRETAEVRQVRARVAERASRVKAEYEATG